MELVYLWVEDYKNIHKQGFNFSPRFDCKFYDEYDKDGKLKDDCKLDIKPKEHIENFFGDNINVTAIVGKNGSGKSNLLEFIVQFEKKLNKFFFGRDESYHIINHPAYLFLYYENGLFYVSLNKIKQYQNLSNKSLLLLSQKKSVEIYDITQKNMSMKSFDTVNNNLIFTNYNYLNILQDIGEDKYKFNACLIRLKEYKSISFDINMNDEKKINQQIREIYDKFLKKEGLKKTIVDIINCNCFSLYLITISSAYGDSFLSCNHIERFLIKSLGRLTKYDNIDTCIIYNEWESFFELAKKYGKNNYEEWYNSYFYRYITGYKYLEKIKNNFKEINPWGYEYSYILNFKEKKIINEIINKFSRLNIGNENNFLLKIDFIEQSKELSYLDLSDGEKNILEISLRIISNVHDKKRIIFVSDEMDNYLHPIWKKELLNIIIKIFNNFPKVSINFIFTTHSPFLLSDIPKQNIIFLDKDENGNCKVVDGLKEKKQTFGANIHTLLSDSFFMEDGLMGEFAKGKIDKAIKLLNQKYLDEKELKYCEQIISIIGEPIVKNQLEKMLHYKKVDYLEKDTKEEIEFLKHRIDLLSKRL